MYFLVCSEVLFYFFLFLNHLSSVYLESVISDFLNYL